MKVRLNLYIMKLSRCISVIVSIYAKILVWSSDSMRRPTSLLGRDSANLHLPYLEFIKPNHSTAASRDMADKVSTDLSVPWMATSWVPFIRLSEGLHRPFQEVEGLVKGTRLTCSLPLYSTLFTSLHSFLLSGVPTSSLHNHIPPFWGAYLKSTQSEYTLEALCFSLPQASYRSLGLRLTLYVITGPSGPRTTLHCPSLHIFWSWSSCKYIESSETLLKSDRCHNAMTARLTVLLYRRQHVGT